jgi:hypothetical protein
MQTHIPDYYVGGLWLDHHEIWLGEFCATSHELFRYAETSCNDELQYIVVLDMIEAQQVYEKWWKKIKNN